MRRFSAFAFCVLLVAVSACQSSNTNQTSANTSSGTTETSTAASSPATAGSPGVPPVATAVKPKVDACVMLNSKEIEAVQGEAVKETKFAEM